MNTVLAAVLNKAPGRLDLEKLVMDTPTPDEVRIDVAFAGLCHSDLHEIDGTFDTTAPIVLGHEAAGVVSAVGSNVRGLRVGDHVVTCLSAFCGWCASCMAGRLTLCTERGRLAQDRGRARLVNDRGEPVRATAGIGAFAEAVVVHQSSAVVIPDDVRLDTASILGCAVTTGMGAVLRRARVRVGDIVAVVGLGGIGIAAVQAARISGAAKVIGVDVVPEKLQRARAFGATHIVNARDDDPVEAVRALTGGGVDHAFEAVGAGATVGQAFAMLAPGGTATVMGMVPDEHSIPLKGSDLFLFEKRLQGSFMGSNHFKTDIPAYLELYRQGRLQLDEMVTHRVPLEGINEGFALMASGDAIRVVAEIGVN